MTNKLYQISFYVPATHCEIVKQALFDAGAGKLGDYDSCAWQTAGQGQFKPLPGSRPYLGKKDELETVDEFKVELMCTKENLKASIQALKSSHPYEVPAYAVIKLEDY